MKPYLTFLLGVVLAGAASVLGVVALGVLFRPNLEVGAPTYDDKTIAAAAAARDTSFDPDRPLVLHRSVDYAEGESGAW